MLPSPRLACPEAVERRRLRHVGCVDFLRAEAVFSADFVLQVPLKPICQALDRRVVGSLCRGLAAKMYHEGRAVSVSALTGAEDCSTGDDEEHSPPHDENSLGSGNSIQRIVMDPQCCRLPSPHNHKSASTPNVHPVIHQIFAVTTGVSDPITLRLAMLAYGGELQLFSNSSILVANPDASTTM